MSTLSVNVVTDAPRGASALLPSHIRSYLIFAAACFAVVLFGSVPASTRIAGHQLDGLSIGLIRAVGAGLLTGLLLLIWRLRPPRGAKDLGLLLLYALGNFAGFPILFSLGTQKTSGFHAALIMATTPLIVGLIGIFLDRRLPRLGWFAGAAIALTGEVALVGMGNVGSAAGATLAGDATVFAGCALSAVGLAAGARLASRMNPLAAACWAMMIAGVGLLPFAAAHALAAPHGYQDLTATTWTVTTWVAMVVITLGAAVLANIALVWALSRGGLARVAPIQFGQPVCALFFATALLDERLTPPLLLVAAAIVFGIVTASRAARSRAPAGKPAPAVAERARSVARYLSPLFFEQEQARGPSSHEQGEPVIASGAGIAPSGGHWLGEDVSAQALAEEPA
jgi:drug/metabolite transporter (DMT)-like permease